MTTRRKIARLEAQLKSAALSPEQKKHVDALSAQALQAMLDGRFDAACKQLAAIEANVRRFLR